MSGEIEIERREAYSVICIDALKQKVSSSATSCNGGLQVFFERAVLFVHTHNTKYAHARSSPQSRLLTFHQSTTGPQRPQQPAAA